MNVPSKLSYATIITAISLYIISLAAIFIDIVLEVIKLSRTVLIVIYCILFFLSFIFGLLGIILLWFDKKKEDNEKKKKNQQKKKEQNLKRKEKINEEKSNRPQIHFDISPREMDTINDYPINSDFFIINSRQYNPALKVRITVILNDIVVMKNKFQDPLNDKCFFQAEILFPKIGEYIVTIHYESKIGIKYYSATKVKCFKENELTWRRIVSGSQEWYIKKGKEWKDITDKVKTENKNGRA